MARSAEMQQVINVVGGYARLRRQRAEAVEAFGFGLTDSLDKREADELTAALEILEREHPLD